MDATTRPDTEQEACYFRQAPQYHEPFAYERLPMETDASNKMQHRSFGE